mmetsp:Transcript_19558/g.41874  ORF Transcript_19558/g.41874 Transcript_19558/m.41874 type:complete len:369 (-) Transcript_19558:475-1581(-)
MAPEEDVPADVRLRPDDARQHDDADVLSPHSLEPLPLVSVPHLPARRDPALARGRLPRPRGSRGRGPPPAVPRRGRVDRAEQRQALVARPRRRPGRAEGAGLPPQPVGRDRDQRPGEGRRRQHPGAETEHERAGGALRRLQEQAGLGRVRERFGGRHQGGVPIVGRRGVQVRRRPGELRRRQPRLQAGAHGSLQGQPHDGPQGLGGGQAGRVPPDHAGLHHAQGGLRRLQPHDGAGRRPWRVPLPPGTAPRPGTGGRHLADPRRGQLLHRGVAGHHGHHPPPVRLLRVPARAHRVQREGPSNARGLLRDGAGGGQVAQHVRGHESHAALHGHQGRRRAAEPRGPAVQGGLGVQRPHPLPHGTAPREGR